jgi:hypothetical protein
LAVKLKRQGWEVENTKLAQKVFCPAMMNISREARHKEHHDNERQTFAPINGARAAQPGILKNRLLPELIEREKKSAKQNDITSQIGCGLLPTRPLNIFYDRKYLHNTP